MVRLAYALLLLVPFLSAQKAPGGSVGGIIGGVVRNAWSKAALRRAVVTLTTTGAEPLDAVAYSDANGVFGFIGVPPGDYYLCVEYAAYQRACFGANEPGRPVPTLALAPGQKKNDIVLAMLPLGSVSGTVTDSDGDPLPNANVTMLRPVYSRRTLHWQPVNNAMTNDRGEYYISFVQPGQYRFMAGRQYQQSSHMQPDVTNGQKLVEDLDGIQFYPNADSIASAATVALNAGNDLKSIDFSLSPVRQALISGRVIAPPGLEANEFVNLQMIPAMPGLVSQQYGSNAAPPEYRFQFQGVPPGQYRLVAMVNSKSHNYRSSETIDAAAGMNELTVSLTPGAPLTGHLKVEGEGAQSHGPYRVRLFWGEDAPFFGQQPETEVKEDGTFRFEDVVPGIWDIGVEPQPPGSYIKAMLLGNKDVLTDDMLLGAGERPSMELVLDLKGAVITGSVLTGSVLTGSVLAGSVSQPQPDAASPGPSKSAGRAMVLLAPEGKFENVLSFYEVVESDAAGKFHFASVTPGRYKIYAFDHMEFEEHWNPDFLKPYASIGEAFDVGEGARLDRQTTLILRSPEMSQ